MSEALGEKSTKKRNAINLTLCATIIIVTGMVSWFAFATFYGLGIGTGVKASPSPSGGSVDYVYLAIKGGCSWCAPPYNSSDQFTPANFTVPSHTLVVITITNYDNGVNQVPTAAAAVSGVLGNVEFQNAAPPLSWGTPASSIPLNSVSHTFTASPSQASPGFNIPLPPSPGPTGLSVTFKLYFNETGKISWECLAYCDTWSMQAPGFMAGTITVV